MFSNKRPSTLGVQNGKLSKCPDSPNCVCSQENRDSFFIEPLYYSGTLEDAKERLIKILEEEPSCTLIDKNENYIYCEFTSSFFKFIDDVEFYFPENESLIHVRSASRLGYYDFGVNRKRIEKIRALFEKE